MAKICPVCESKIGFLLKARARDGIICSHCAKITLSHETKSVEDIKAYWRINEEREDVFTQMQKLYSFSIDYEHELFTFGDPEVARVPLIYYHFNEMENYKAQKINSKDKIIYVNMRNYAGKSQFITTPNPTVLAFFDECITKNKATKQKRGVSSANEILRYKKLLDQGIITETEFELKKKQLLNL